VSRRSSCSTRTARSRLWLRTAERARYSAARRSSSNFAGGRSSQRVADIVPGGTLRTCTSLQTVDFVLPPYPGTAPPAAAIVTARSIASPAVLRPTSTARPLPSSRRYSPRSSAKTTRSCAPWRRLVTGGARTMLRPPHVASAAALCTMAAPDVDAPVSGSVSVTRARPSNSTARRRSHGSWISRRCWKTPWARTSTW
jgi:hypothetical protein